MDDVRGDFLGPPHGTTPAAVIANKNRTNLICMKSKFCLQFVMSMTRQYQQ